MCVTDSKPPHVPEASWKLFCAKVEVQENGCWYWTGATTWNGYGKLYRKGKTYRAHKFAWEAFNGTIPDGLVARHSCDTPICCNPACIEPGTQKENIADMIARGRQRKPRVREDSSKS